MKRFTLTALLITIIVGGFVFGSLDNFGAAIPSEGRSTREPQEPTPIATSVPTNTSNGNASPVHGQVAADQYGNGNGNSATISNHGNNTNVIGDSNGGNGNSGNSRNGDNGNRNAGGGNNGNGNGNNVNNGNGNNGNANGNGNGNGNSNGNNGNGNNGNGNSGNNGNAGDNGNNGNGNNGNSGNEHNDNNGNSGNNGNENNGNNGNNGNGNDNGNNPSPTPTPIPTPTPTQNPMTFKISGHILDSNGKGIASAMIIFNVPNIVPAVYSDYSGYYVMYAPRGNYHVNVWPPFDSNYIFYDQPSFAVGADTTKDITLFTGYKVSGKITDASGAPISGAVVSLNNFLCGWYSNYQGQYFVTAPPGTYTFSVRPKSGLTFPSYTETGFVLNGNIVKDIVLGGPQPTPTPTSNPAPSPKPTPASNTIYVQVQHQYDGKVVFTNEKVHSSPQSVKLLVPKDATQGSFAMALYPYNGSLGSISSFSIMTSYTTAVPRFVLCLEKNGHGWPDTFLLSDYQFASNGDWKSTTGGNRWGWTETNIQMSNYGSFWNPIDFWTAKYGNLKVDFIGLILEYWAVDPEGLGQPLYADELTVNGVAHNIAPVPGAMPTSSAILSLAVEAKFLEVGSMLTVNGTLSDQNGNSLTDKTVILSYSVANSGVWTLIGSGKTSTTGSYSIEWLIPASGTFTLKVEWTGNSDYASTSASTTLSFAPSKNALG